MSRNYYSEINLHITWHTKNSAPVLVPKIETVVHHYLRGRCRLLRRLERVDPLAPEAEAEPREAP